MTPFSKCSSDYLKRIRAYFLANASGRVSIFVEYSLDVSLISSGLPILAMTWDATSPENDLVP